MVIRKCPIWLAENRHGLDSQRLEQLRIAIFGLAPQHLPSAGVEAGRDAIGRYAGSLPPDETVYSSPEMPDHPAIVYNSGARPGMKGSNGRVCIVTPDA